MHYYSNGTALTHHNLIVDGVFFYIPNHKLLKLKPIDFNSKFQDSSNRFKSWLRVSSLESKNMEIKNQNKIDKIFGKRKKDNTKREIVCIIH